MAERRFLMEAANGMQVWVPESRLEAWQQEQQRQKESGGTLTPEQEKMVRQIVERIYGPKTQQEQND